MRAKMRRLVSQALADRGIYRLGRNPFGTIDRDVLLRRHGITVVADAGGNIGQYGDRLRRLGFTGRIVSFEPSSEAYALLERRAAGDPNWETMRMAVGDEDGTAAFNIASETVCNSFRPMNDQFANEVPGVALATQEMVEVRRLDTVLLPSLPAAGIWVKFDVEGHELAAIEGARGVIERAAVVEVELATEALYEGEPLFFDVAPVLYDMGLRLTGVASAYQNPAGRTLRFDGVFDR